MYPYQQQYQPTYRDYHSMAQAAPVTTAPAGAPIPAQAAPPPRTGPSTAVKVAETVLTVGVTGAIAYTGIKTGMSKKGTDQVVGYVAGVGGVVLGLAALTSIVSPSFARTINPFRFA
jgi:hypothetical protein